MFPTQMDQASHSDVDNDDEQKLITETTCRLWRGRQQSKSENEFLTTVFRVDCLPLVLISHSHSVCLHPIFERCSWGSINIIYQRIGFSLSFSFCTTCTLSYLPRRRGGTDTDDIEAQIATHFSMTLMKMEDVLQPFVQFVHAVCVLGVEWEKNAILRCCWTLNENFRTSDTRCRHSTCWSSPEMNFHFNSNIYFQ